MSWITLDTKIGRHPKMAELPNDAARYGWILTLAEAKEQRTPGTFASDAHYRHVMTRHGRYLPAYIKAGLLDKDEDGTIHVHDWTRHQWAVKKALQREGQREDIEGTVEGQKEDASRAVSVPVYVEGSNGEERVQREGGLPNIDGEAQTFLEGITGRLVRQAGDKQLAEYDRQIADHGLPNVISAYQRVAKLIRGTPTATQLVWSGRKVLEPFVDPRDVAEAERTPRPRIVRPPVDEQERNRIIRELQEPA